jgi:hypothetical protein
LLEVLGTQVLDIVANDTGPANNAVSVPIEVLAATEVDVSGICRSCCSMKSCGNHAKVGRFRARRR